MNEHAQKELLLAGEQSLGGRRKASSLSISAEVSNLLLSFSSPCIQLLVYFSKNLNTKSKLMYSLDTPIS